MNRRAVSVAGIIIVIAALWPPVDEAASELFSVHMLQHLVLMLVAAPVLAASGIVRVRARLLRSPVLVAVMNAVVVWVWHLPDVYDAAMRNDGLHVLEHALFLSAGVLFWTVVFDVTVDRFKRVAFVFVTMLQSGALGAVIAFARAPLYEWHSAYTPSGYDVLGQQQLAGAIMWIPPGVLYLVVMLILIGRALSAFDAAEQS